MSMRQASLQLLNYAHVADNLAKVGDSLDRIHQHLQLQVEELGKQIKIISVHPNLEQFSLHYWTSGVAS